MQEMPLVNKISKSLEISLESTDWIWSFMETLAFQSFAALASDEGYEIKTKHYEGKNFLFIFLKM